MIAWLIMPSNCIYSIHNSKPLIYKALRDVELL
nr:MAG TPA: hypothetical protein [Bacteriophage sp.]